MKMIKNSLLFIFVIFFVSSNHTIAENMLNTELKIELNHPKLSTPSKFLKHDKPIDEQYVPLSWWDLRKYKQAFRIFPTVKECLISSDIEEDNLDLTKFNWPKLNNNPKAQVCLYRVTDALETPERGTAWFESQGFDVDLTIYAENHSQYGGARFVAYWPFRDKGNASPFKNVHFKWLIETSASGGVSIVVEYNKNSKVKHIDINYSRI